MNSTSFSPKQTYDQMRHILEPRSVAIIGASNKIHRIGGAITRNALESNYRGDIYLVNPRLTQIFGKPVYAQLSDIPGPVDLIEIIIPAPKVPMIIDEAITKGVKGAIIISAGFAEIGNQELQDEVMRIATKGGIRVLGPNCFGIINTDIDLDLSFTFTKALKGSLAFISQSGAMCCGTLDWAYKEELGFSKFINLGNKCDLDESDALLYLENDAQTEIIAMYLEGIINGRRLFQTIHRVSQSKPIILLKAGVTEPGARAALSHTASIAGSSRIVKAAFKQAGAIVVEDVEELFDAAQALVFPPVAGRNVAIVSNAGGLGVMTTDWCHQMGLHVPPLTPETIKTLQTQLLPIASPINPIDMTGSADYDTYKNVLEVLVKTDYIDIIITIFVSQGLVTSDGPARAVVETLQQHDMPILTYWMGGNSIFNGVRILRRANIPVYTSPAKVAKAAATLFSYSRSLQKMKNEDGN
jgi:acetyl coenzyme A synthetase (ADP forming)-like protein